MTNNRYFVLRHGKSLANEAKIIVSDAKNGVLSEWGLSDEGIKQAQSVDIAPVLSAFSELKQQEPESTGGSTVVGKIVVFASNFSRARQTAEIVHKRLRDIASKSNNNAPEADEVVDPEVHIRVELRERFFGQFELQSNEHYDDVWKFDADDASHHEYGAESVQEVSDRTMRLIRELDARYENCCIVLVSHGDTLQILQANYINSRCGSAGGYDIRKHRLLPHLNTCELRQL